MPHPLLALAADISTALALSALALVALLYVLRARAVSARGRALPSWRVACFLAGAGLLAGVFAVLGQTSRELLYVRMIEDLLVCDIAPMLLVLGLTAPLLERPRELAALRWLRALRHPLPAFLLWAAAIYAWHAPALYEAALRDPAVHAAQAATMLAAGVNMWMCLLGPLPAPAWFQNSARLFYVAAVRLAGAALGNIFLWSGTVFYDYYLPGDAVHHISPLADQNIAGAILTAEQSALTIGVIAWIFMRVSREHAEHRRLVDLARAQGLQLNEARVARAVATGRADELRRRLESLAR